jgi:hypothetical protein
MVERLVLVVVLFVVTAFSLYGLSSENTGFSASGSDGSNRTGISQTDINADDDDILKVQILANSLEKRLDDTAAILEITGNLSEVRSTPNASLLSSTLESLHGIPEDADLEKRSVAQDIISNYDDIQVIAFLMPNGDVYLEQPYSRQQNLTSDNLSFRDYHRGAVSTNSTYLGNVIKSASSNRSEALVAVPLYFPSNQSLLGIWAGGMDFSLLNEELQSLDLTGNNERVVYVDGNGTKIADSDETMALNTSESFSNLESFQNAIDGKSGSIEENVGGLPMLVSYYPVEALQNTWAVLWMRPIGIDITYNTTVTDSAVVNSSYNSERTTSDNSSYEFEGGFPTADTVELAYNNTDLGRAIEAYKFFYPTMVNEAMMQVESQSNESNQVGIKLVAGPPHQIFTANSDTPYIMTTLDLRAEGPVVIEVPPGRFMGLADDHNMRWILDMGIYGPDKGQGGKHLILPPDYTGDVPAGYYVGQSNTWKVLTFIRSVPTENNMTSALQSLDGITIYPLSKSGGEISPYRFIDMTNTTLPNKLLEWEDNLEYWQQLKKVVDTETVPVEFRPMYGMLQSLGIEKGIPFNPDARTTSILEEAAKKAIAEMRVNAYANRDPERLVWDDRNWEWIPITPFNTTTRDMGVAEFLDLQATEHAYFQAIGASPLMSIREIDHGSIYFSNFHDNNNVFLNGSKTYKLTVPGPVPANLFWSATVYDVDTRSEIATDQNRSAIRSLFEDPQPNPDGSIDLYFGPEVPEGEENHWVKTIPDQGWFVYFRIYGPQAPVFDGTWKLNNIVEMK